MSIGTPLIIVSQQIGQSQEFLSAVLLDLGATLENSTDTLQLQPDKGSIGIDQVRLLQNFLATKPISQKKKLGIIFQAQTLTAQAQNALLKTLEEGPADSQIIFITSDESFLLPTVLSRCQVIFPPSKQSPLGQTPTEQTKFRQVLLAIQGQSLTTKLQFASDFSGPRENVLQSLDSLLVALHADITKINNPRLTRAIFEAKKRLKANCNVRLTMENLFINW